MKVKIFDIQRKILNHLFSEEKNERRRGEGGLMIPNIGPGSHSEPGGLVHTGATWPTVHPTALRKKTKMLDLIIKIVKEVKLFF